MAQNLLTNDIVKCSVPFADLKDFTPLIKMAKDKKVVMLGEATHGTKEFYEWRNMITAELIQKHGFNFVAVEGDWPACAAVNKFVKRKTQKGTFDTLSSFSRWPTWMWANDEMVKFMDWLRERNMNSNEAVGFHGLDVYSLYESINEIVVQLEEHDPDLALKVREYYACFDPYLRDEKLYVRSLFNLPEGCEAQVSEALATIIGSRIEDPEVAYDLKRNASLIQNAELYYRTMAFGERGNSWNVRDEHMMETLDDLLKHYGPKSKCIVWAHNTHIGDYRGTDMVINGEINIGGLARRKYGDENVALIGFSTYKGSVIASHAWSGPVKAMEVPEAREGSIDQILHESIPMVGHDDFYLMLNEVGVDSSFTEFKGQRAIGVVYDPRHEKWGNYVPTSLARRYDALIFIDETSALTPLPLFADNLQMPETYPFDDLP